MSDIRPEFYSIEQASEVLGISIATVRRRIRDGHIHAVQPGGQGTLWLIPIGQIARLADADVVATAPVPSPHKSRIAGPRPAWQRKK